MIVEDIPDSETAFSASPLDLRKRLGESASAPSVRPWVYAERFKPNGEGPYRRRERAARDQRYKLIRFRGEKADRFYDLAIDPWEANPLPPGPSGLSARSASSAVMLAITCGTRPMLTAISR